jgi:hypothetical protein
MSQHIIRARYTELTIRVYQAYSPSIALPALEAGTLVPPFKKARMTWIKPSFNWMMYRSHFATKSDQDIVLGIDITREGFDWALRHSVLSAFTPAVHATFEAWQALLATRPVRIQWDPERDWRLNIVPGVRTIQIGLSGEAVERFVDEWIVQIEDVTSVAREISVAVERGIKPERLPDQLELAYPIDPAIAAQLHDGHEQPSNGRG